MVLAGIVYVDLQDHGGIVAAVEASPGFNSDTLKMIPDFEWDLKTATFLILVCIGWLNYAPGFGFFLQRTLAARSEKDAMLSLYWFAFCHLVLRCWPWIIVGVDSSVYFPAIPVAEQSYPMMFYEFLPEGLKSIMLV